MQTLFLTSLTIGFPALICGAIFWFTAQTRRGILFGVSVPLSFASTPDARSILNSYRASIACLTLAALGSTLPVALRAMPWLPAATLPALVLGALGLWLRARYKLLPYAVPVPTERTASLKPNASAFVWFGAMALALAPLAAAWFYLRNQWSQIPSRFATHWDVTGVPNAWSTRSVQSVAMPLILGGALILLMIVIATFMRLAPMVDRQRSARSMLPTLTLLTWSFAIFFSWIGLMPLHPPAGPRPVLTFALVHLFLVACVVGWMVSKLMSTHGREAYDGTPDAGWRVGGLIYYNSADAAVVVPKRLGWGWTFNFARSASWLYLVAVLIFCTFVILMTKLLR